MNTAIPIVCLALQFTLLFESSSAEFTSPPSLFNACVFLTVTAREMMGIKAASSSDYQTLCKLLLTELTTSVHCVLLRPSIRICIFLMSMKLLQQPLIDLTISLFKKLFSFANREVFFNKFKGLVSETYKSDDE